MPSGRHLPEKLLAEVEAATLPQKMHTYRKARKSKQAVDAYLRAGNGRGVWVLCSTFLGLLGGGATTSVLQLVSSPT